MVMLSCSLMAQGTYTENRDHSYFDKVSFGVAGDVEISIGDRYSVKIEGPSEVVGRIHTEVRDGVLHIERERNSNISFSNKRVIVYLTMPVVEGVYMAGSGNIRVNDPIKSDLEAKVSGSGDIIVGDIFSDEVKCAISGSGNILFEGEGKVSEMEMRISGSGSFRAERTEVEEMDISISGSGKCECNVVEELNVTTSGSGNVYYSGRPRVKAVTSGSGRVLPR